FWLIDRPGLLVDDMAKLMPFQQPYARPRSEVKDWFKLVDGSIDLGEVIRQVKPTTLIGSSTVHGAFNESIVKSMAAGTKRPIILPLSNPTHLAEANPNDLLRWTNGQALVATGSPFKEVSYQGQKREIAQCNNALVFPGIGLGIVATHAERLTGNMLTAACLALSRHAPVHRDKSAPLLPPISEAKAVSFGVAKAVAEQAIKDTQWQPKYLPYRLRTV
ncbi:MAG: NAD-dependent malic enzyme, partial [Gammaproteobacteria bacterium]|nr:NAD-dependent malic enzyme [Gammaproteobacteria bacterium]